jgi:hypothetical protein
LEMLDGANMKADDKSNQALFAELNLADVPLLKGALELAEDGWRSSLYPQLEPYLRRCMFTDQKEVEGSTNPRRLAIELLLDPQTSGGLLVTISEANAAVLLEGQGGSDINLSSNFVVIGKVKKKTSRIADHIGIVV